MSSAKEGLTDIALTVESVNAAHRPTWLRVRRRARRDLRPVEVAVMTRYRVELSGKVLELGSRGDALTNVLVYHAADFTGVGFTAPEVDLCRGRFAHTQFLHRDLVDLGEFEDGEFDAVIAGRYALDHLGDDQRRLLLGRLSRIIAEDGVLIFSSHNLARESLVRSPLAHALLRPWTMAKLPSALRNRSLLGRLQQRSHGFAVLNDGTDGFSRLSYFISPAAQQRQLHEHDFSLLECVDRNDDHVGMSDDAYSERELYFVARPGVGLWTGRSADSELI